MTAVRVWFIALLLPAALLAQSPAVSRAGAAEARLVIQMYADLDSVPASHAAAVLRVLLDQHPDSVAVEFHHRPADGRAHPADAAVLAAARQQRGWDMAELLLANQDRRHGRDFTAMAQQLGLDLDRFAADFADEGAASQAVDDDLVNVTRLGLSKDALLVVNGSPVAATVSQIETAFASLLVR